jgi:hypothetical protein
MNTMITSWQVQWIFNVENYFIWKILFLEIKYYKFFQKIFKNSFTKKISLNFFWDENLNIYENIR